MKEGKKGPGKDSPQTHCHGRVPCSIFISGTHVPSFIDSPAPRFRLSHSSASYCLWWVGSTFFVGSVWHPQGLRRENEVCCERRTRLLY